MKDLRSVFTRIGGKNVVSNRYIDELAELTARRAENFFKEHRLSCSETALLVVNIGFEGGLTTRQVLGLASGFGGGVGGSGCTCGALSGAVMALGLFLGPVNPNGLGEKKFRELVGRFHDRFRDESGSACCRELIADFRKDRKGQASFCRGLTGRFTGEAVRIILGERPELVERVNLGFLQAHDSGISVVLKKLLGHRKGDIGSGEEIQKTYVNLDGKAVVKCPSCRLIKTMQVDKFRDSKHTLNVKCTCQKTFPVNLDFRKFYRKSTNLTGSYILLPQKTHHGQMLVVNISKVGFGLRILGNHGLLPGQELQISFTLDDESGTLIDRRMIIRLVDKNYVGCEFMGDASRDKALGFYLMD